jgi:hypothetical protein
MAVSIGSIWAVIKFGWRYLSRRQNRMKVESYLKSQKALKHDKGQRTAIHLAAKLKLSESEVLEAVTSNPRITLRIIANKKTGKAESLLYEYNEI